MVDPSGWVKKYGDYLFSVAMIKVNNSQVAEDLVQDTFLSAIKAVDSFKGNSTEKTWLTVILNNKIIDHYRKKDVLKESESYLQETEKGFHAAFFETHGMYGHWTSEAAPKKWESSDVVINQKEFYKILHLCIAKMPSKLIPVFIAKLIDEEDADTICKEFNLTSSNYWVMIHRAKVLMRSCLEKNWFLQ